MASCGPPESRFDFSAADNALEGVLAQNDIEGATLVIVHRDHGIVHLRGFGRFPRDRVSLIASSSKIISAGVLVRLADQGLLDLDAPISDYLPADWGTGASPITTAQLLSNSAGMLGLSDPFYPPYVCQYFPEGTLGACGRSIYTADDADTRVPPDTTFRYGGAQWQLAGAVAEAVSGKTWAELVDETYTQPCGLDVLGYTNHFARAYAEGGPDGAFQYPSFFDGDVSKLDDTQNPNVEGRSYTTARDYGKTLLMQLRGGLCGPHRVLSEAGVARMQADRIGSVYQGATQFPEFQGYGLGWWVSRTRPGLRKDEGIYGASPFIDTTRGYGVMVIVEGTEWYATETRDVIRPLVEAAFDAAGL